MDATREAMRRTCQQAEMLGLTLGSNVVPIYLAAAKRNEKKPRRPTKPHNPPPKAA